MVAGPSDHPPVRLAVVFDQELTGGGGYQQAVNDALAVTRLDASLCEPVFLTTAKENVAELRKLGIEATYLRVSSFMYARLWLRRRIIAKQLLRPLTAIFGQNPFDKALDRHAAGLVYFVSPCLLALFTEKYNYIFTLWDLCHRDQVEFPEVRTGRIFERRETLYYGALPRATATIVDSQLGRENALRRYGLDADRVVVRPFSPSASIDTDRNSAVDQIDIKAKYGLSGDYVVYPAQFWPHKNHVYLLRGLAELERRHGLKLHAIMSGSDKGNLAHVTQTAQDLGLSDRVHFPGFVSSEELSCLYRQALALVMPTYFGPTNIPPLEAFAFGTPVIYSNLPGLKEQTGEAALLAELDDPGSLAEHLQSLAAQPELRDKLAQAGRRQLEHLAAQSGDWLEKTLRRFQVIRATWPAP
ncbi:MAG: glycosyltransferase family 4 protein [Alphaproteobacteria bacterium]|nr:glycosyltransferase family 4 protein [Alphaproteobacteria bacterium]